MAGTPREQAKLRQRLAQVFALVAVAAAAWVVIERMPMTKGTPVGKTPIKQPTIAQAGGEGPELEPLDSFELDLLEGQWNTIANAPEKRPEVETPIDPPIDTPPGGDDPVEGDPVFVASIIGGGIESAVLRIGEDQIWLRKGTTKKGVELVEVGPDFARVNIEGREGPVRVEQGERTGPAVSTLASGAPSPNGTTNGTPTATPNANATANSAPKAEGTSEEQAAQRRLEEMRRRAIERRNDAERNRRNGNGNGNGQGNQR